MTSYLPIDLEIQGDVKSIFKRSYYISSVYFHIIEVTDNNNDILKTVIVTVDLRIQVHELFCMTFIISACTHYIGNFLVSISTFYISHVIFSHRKCQNCATREQGPIHISCQTRGTVYIKIISWFECFTKIFIRNLKIFKCWFKTIA